VAQRWLLRPQVGGYPFTLAGFNGALATDCPRVD
jgi:hypothetical protein